jgi:hypothetical protein
MKTPKKEPEIIRIHRQEAQPQEQPREQPRDKPLTFSLGDLLKEKVEKR